MHDSEIQSLQSKLDQCESGNQDAIITKNELDLCRGELTDEQNSKQQINQDLQSAKENIKTLKDQNKKLNQSLQSAKRNIETLKDDKKELQNQMVSEKAESKRLLDKTRKLENEKQRLNNRNRNLENSLDSCQETVKIFVHGRSV